MIVNTSGVLAALGAMPRVLMCIILYNLAKSHEVSVGILIIPILEIRELKYRWVLTCSSHATNSTWSQSPWSLLLIKLFISVWNLSDVNSNYTFCDSIKLTIK